ncbi:hypothetical protein [Mycobacterium kyogaense]|uniref:hypothetical protein n=1 Tax=Mycobacterium kyogaense TaxID=2212479 RepID=UPI000DAEEB19|nr:hypothetical protein [Mycobacterium kyogaense]
MRRIAWLSATALVLLAAFLFAPALLVGDGLATIGGNAALTRAFEANLTAFWNAGTAEPTPGLADLVDLWRRWHALKIAISLLFAATTVGLSAALWGRFLAPDRSRAGRVRTGSAAVAAMVSVLGGLVAIAANIQATAAPLSALLPLLPTDPPAGDLRRAVSQIHEGIVHADSAFAARPALAVLIDSQRTYLTALAVTTTVMAIGCAVGTGCAARRFPRAFGIAGAVITAAVVVAAVAAWMSAADPVGSLLGIFSLE